MNDPVVIIFLLFFALIGVGLVVIALAIFQLRRSQQKATGKQKTIHSAIYWVAISAGVLAVGGFIYGFLGGFL